MSQASYWITPFALHEVPQAIINLASQAERKASGRWMCDTALPQATFPHEQESVWFKVIAEWGAWRESEDRREYESQRKADNGLRTDL
jgi:hypothetical protein